MQREPLALAFSVACALTIMTWIVWSELPDAGPLDDAPPSADAAGGVPPVDQTRVAELEAAAAEDPDDAAARVALGHLYFDAHAFEAAIPWYEDALEHRPDDLESSTNLGVSYFYVGEADRALAQFEHSLTIEADHPQTLLNLGIVRAFGLDDVEGAIAVWERVLQVAPDGPEARAAREALSRVAADRAADPEGAVDRP